MRRTLKQSITLRTLVVGTVLAAVLCISLTVLVVAIHDQRETGRAALRSQETISAGTALETTLVGLENGLRGYVASGRPELLAPFTEARGAYPGQVARLRALVADDPGQRRAVARIEREIDDYVGLWALPLLEVARTRLPVARSAIVTGTGRVRLGALRERFAELFRRERAVAAARERSAERGSDIAVGLGLAGIGLVVLFAIGLWRFLRRSILRPVLSVAAATETVAAGDLGARVPAEREDELGSLARSFNAMTASLEEGRAELERRTADLERSNAELEQYAQMASHDLQAPLATISMYTELLGRRAAQSGDAGTAELLTGVESSAAWMRALIRDLLHLSRVGRGELRRERVDGDDMLATVLENLAGPISDRRAEVDVQAPLPPVLGDRRQLCQVFQNLVGNAIKFSDGDAPRVAVRGRVEGDTCHFEVEDNGIGIDPAQSERIFQPFQRLHGEERYEGTGVGLAICQKVVVHHGGRIWAEGRPGAGSTFHVVLPRAPGPRRPPVAAEGEGRATAGAGAR